MNIRVSTGILCVLCVVTLLLLFRNIERTLPYPHHSDEGFIAGPASKILQTGDLHPYKFNYPSLPAYIAAASMAVGFVRSATHLEVSDINRIGHVGYPYYETPRVMQTARQTFAILSVICLAMTGLSAWLAFREPATIVLAPLILLASPLFFRHSWTYLNVDIVATSLIMMTLAACLLGTRRPSLQQLAVVPGILAGLATASKYTLAVGLLPILLAIALYVQKGRKVATAFLAAGAMLGGFLAAVPYALIDIPGFLNGVASEAFHYASGHSGFAGEPGVRQLLHYVRHFLSEFGYGAVILAVVGMSLFARRDGRSAAVLGILPAALLWLLSSQRVNFTRNALPIEPFVAMFAAFGFVVVHEWAIRLATRRGWKPKHLNMSVLLGLVLLIAAVPLWHFREHFRDRTDSRNRAAAWLAEELPANWGVVVPNELGFDVRSLESGGRLVKRINLRSAGNPQTLRAVISDVPAPAVIMLPRWGADPRWPGKEEAETLNSQARQWRVVKKFGTNDVLLNYSFSTAWGDPAFAVAVVK